MSESASRRVEADLTLFPSSVYEFIQRRSDWKKIEKTVDKVRGEREAASVTTNHGPSQSMYALSVKEDCVIM